VTAQEQETPQEQAEPSVGGALAELEAAGRRSGDAALAAAIRRTRWQMGRLEQRCAAAEAKAARDAATVETLRRQRDRLVADLSVSAVAKLQARIEAQAAELSGALTAARNAIAERDEARASWETLRVAALKAAPSPSHPALVPTASAPAVITDAAIREENELTEKRERLVAEQQRLQAEATRLKETGCANGPEAGRVKQGLGEIQRSLQEIVPRLKPLRIARNEEINRLKRELRRLEPYKPPAGEAVKATETTA
jgi:DNA repair exonuclease SbcCD ATPase subunit